MAEKDRKMILTNCVECGCDIFHRPNKTKLRCRKCFYKFHSESGRVRVICSHCGKHFLKRKSSLDSSKNSLYFCTRKCKDTAQSLAGNCDKIRPSHYGTSKGKHLWGVLIKKATKCESCPETKKYLFQIHHKDGNRENNIEENLEVVCCNCHAKRHLKLNEDNQWCYDTDFLTPRDMINKI